MPAHRLSAQALTPAASAQSFELSQPAGPQSPADPAESCGTFSLQSCSLARKSAILFLAALSSAPNPALTCKPEVHSSICFLRSSRSFSESACALSGGSDNTDKSFSSNAELLGRVVEGGMNVVELAAFVAVEAVRRGPE
jgi:hypothetical protein